MTEAPGPKPGQNTARTIAIVIGLIGLNVYICRELFRMEYLARMGSIEAAYISISRYLLEHGLHLDWFPLWYGGIPFQNTYPPLLHVMVAVNARVFNISPAHSHHAVTAALYCLGPVTLYFLAARLSGSWRIGLAAGVAYSLVSPSAFLSSTVLAFAGSHRDPARFKALIEFGDGPHIAALTFLPLAILALDWTLAKKGVLRVYITALACSAVVLTNWLGAFALALAVISYLLARGAIGELGLHRVLTTAGTAVLAYTLCLPWIPPSTIGRVMHNAQYIGGEYPMDWHQVRYAIVLASVAGLLFWVFRRTGAPLLTGFSCFFALFSSALVLGFEQLGVSLMPQPHRYHHEMDLSLCLAGVCVIALAFKFLPSRYRTSTYRTGMVLVGVAFLLWLQAKTVRRDARTVMGPIDISKTVEYEAATWLRDHLGDKRVFMTGSTQFWLNAFTDVPQVGGGFGQGIVNERIPVVHWGVPWMVGDGVASVLWLKLFGVSAVVVSSPTGRDAYREAWRDPEKFRNLVPEIFRDGGDVIYGLPQRSDSLAHVISARDVVTKAPENVTDLDPMRALAAALEDVSLPLADLRWEGSSTAVIRTDMRPDQLLFVQITYHPGWHASVAGQKRPIHRDGLGFMIVEPNCSGPCEVRLVYDGGPEMYIAKLASGMSLLAGFLLAGWTAARTLLRSSKARPLRAT